MKDIEQYKNRFYNLMESTMGDVKPLITEQTSVDCKSLVEIPKGGLNTPGAQSQGYEPTSKNTWVEDIKKVADHTKAYEIYTSAPIALSTLSKCRPSKKSVDFVEFRKGNQYITYIGQD